ncbi:hypothetical protein C0995_001604 [Termitomyces sp. Mi166|nr:hypothetical protein C0995_001604 [Termitomyces sp. Mi166\
MMYSRTIFITCVGASALVSAAPAIPLTTLTKIKSVASKALHALEYAGSAATIAGTVAAFVPQGNETQAREFDEDILTRAVLDEHEALNQMPEPREPRNWRYTHEGATTDGYPAAASTEARDFGDELETRSTRRTMRGASKGTFMSRRHQGNKGLGSDYVEQRNIPEKLDELD